MAYSSWLKVDPTSGSGDATVNVSSSAEHTGRVARETTMTFKAANCDDVERTVIQAGIAEYVEFDSTTYAVDKDGGTLTITGTTNSSKLTFSLGSGDLTVTIPETYLANSKETANGAEVVDDPGQSAEFPFSITFTIPANTTTSAESIQIIVTDNAGNTSMTTISETAGDPYLRVITADPIYLEADGTAVSVVVESNTSWTIE